MAEIFWKLLDAEGRELRTTEAFESREDAEGWMGSEWSRLAAEGVESVSLHSGDEELYRMSLAPE